MKKLLELYRKNREVIDYLFWGGVAFFLSLFLFWLFTDSFGWNEVFANNVDWVICVLFTFVTNKLFVFRSRVYDPRGFLKEFVSFVAARLFTLILEDVIIWAGCTMMGYNEGLGRMIVKFIAQFVVIVTNYILSKLIVFRKKKTGDNAAPERDVN